MSDEMKYAKIAYIIPFENAKDGIHEPALVITQQSGKEVRFDVTLFFIGLNPGTIYNVSCSVSPADDKDDFFYYVTQKKFQMDDVLNQGRPLPSAFNVPVILPSPIASGQYKIEAKLSSENSNKDEFKKAISFIEIITTHSGDL
ncbi:hypothetical protein [Enterobacter kobei]|uniref:hypothetical protein n=1 Tax=Enterobacter kobei TaxID=208224 RepID=UPI00200583F0|nr:hypothetical protein [Enterobacter kobei]MCK7106411.1 hypothetical protein [Enterobacter kobei]